MVAIPLRCLQRPQRGSLSKHLAVRCLPNQSKVFRLNIPADITLYCMECVFCGVIRLEHVVIYGFTFECRQYRTI